MAAVSNSAAALEGCLPTLLTSQARKEPAPLQKRGRQPYAIKLPEECEADLPEMVIHNTFLDTTEPRPPSLEPFYRERSVQTCPGSRVGLLDDSLFSDGHMPLATVASPTAYVATPMSTASASRTVVSLAAMLPDEQDAKKPWPAPTEQQTWAAAQHSWFEPYHQVQQQQQQQQQQQWSAGSLLGPDMPPAAPHAEQSWPPVTEQSWASATAQSWASAAERSWPSAAERSWPSAAEQLGLCAPPPPPQAPPSAPPAQPPANGLALPDAAPTPDPPSAPALGTDELPSFGSALHGAGNCKPCAFLHTKGCENGVSCQFCHLCDAGEKKRRRSSAKK